jgi:DNA-binding CsgD family transcriptional regulator
MVEVSGDANNPYPLSASSSISERSGFSTRELEIIHCIAGGMKNADIAKTLFLSKSTVENYISQIYQKVGSNNRIKLGELARCDAAPAKEQLIVAARREFRYVLQDVVLAELLSLSHAISEEAFDGIAVQKPIGRLDELTCRIQDLLDDCQEDRRSGIPFSLALAHIVERMRERSSRPLDIAVRIDAAVVDTSLGPHARSLALRVVSETGAIVSRRSAPSRLAIRVDVAATYATVNVEDNRVGLGVSPGAMQRELQFGLRKVSEQVGRFGGTLDLQALAHGGTLVIAVIPLAPRELSPA